MFLVALVSDSYHASQFSWLSTASCVLCLLYAMSQCSIRESCHIQQDLFHLLLKTCLTCVAVHASGWTFWPGSHLTGLCCGALTQHSQTTSIAGWDCSHYCAWYILHLTYVCMSCFVANIISLFSSTGCVSTSKIWTTLVVFRWRYCWHACEVQLALLTCCLQSCLCCVRKLLFWQMSKICWCTWSCISSQRIADAPVQITWLQLIIKPSP